MCGYEYEHHEIRDGACPTSLGLTYTPENPDEWHGWRIGGKALHIGELPDRKQHALYVLDGNVIRPLAFFPTEPQAREALEMLDKIAHATGVLR